MSIDLSSQIERITRTAPVTVSNIERTLLFLKMLLWTRTLIPSRLLSAFERRSGSVACNAEPLEKRTIWFRPFRSTETLGRARDVIVSLQCDSQDLPLLSTTVARVLCGTNVMLLKICAINALTSADGSKILGRNKEQLFNALFFRFSIVFFRPLQGDPGFSLILSRCS